MSELNTENITWNLVAPALAEQRAYMALDWLARVSAPAWLRLAGLGPDAEALEQLEPLATTETAEAALPTLRAIRATLRKAARVARVDEAGKAAWSAVFESAGLAAWQVIIAAAGTASWPAVRELAGAPSWEIVRMAGRAAARTATLAGGEPWVTLEPTSLVLQASAQDLFKAMAAAG